MNNKTALYIVVVMIFTIGAWWLFLSFNSNEKKSNHSETQPNLERSPKYQPLDSEITLSPDQHYVLKPTPPLGSFTRNSTVRIYGRSATLAASLKIDEVPLPVDEYGYFEYQLPLKLGMNQFTFSFEDINAKILEKRVLEWNFDATAPYFRFNDLSPDQIIYSSTLPAKISGIFIEKDGDIVAMPATDIQSITANGNEMTISEDKTSFYSELPLEEGTNNVEVIAVDLAGNTTARTVQVVVNSLQPEIILDERGKTQGDKPIPLLHFTGAIHHAEEAMFGNRPIFMDGDGTFDFEIYPPELAKMCRDGYGEIVARNRLGSEKRVAIPNHCDFQPPYWLYLSVKDHDGADVTLQGKVSEGSVQVFIKDRISKADPMGIVTIEGVTLEEGGRFVKTKLLDPAGNQSLITQQLTIGSSNEL